MLRDLILARKSDESSSLLVGHIRLEMFTLFMLNDLVYTVQVTVVTP